jgi:glycosyltransferase involved in cell wall biosynthesis
MLDQYANVKANWTWLGEREDIPELLTKHRALIHPSLYEGLPNVVCEALIAGRPVLVSDVCDHAILVKNKERGFLFDPLDPKSIADAIEYLTEQSDAQWRDFTVNARRYATKSFGIDRMVREYEELFMNNLDH